MPTRTRIAFTLAAVLWVSFSVQQATARVSRGIESPSPFSFVVDASGPGIMAVCGQGCAWEEVSATYPGGRYRITEEGIEPGRGDVHPTRESPASGRFSVVLSTSGEGINAACGEGCAWNTVSANYPSSTYQITAHGIGPGR